MFLIRFFCFLKISCSIFGASDIPTLMVPEGTSNSDIVFPVKSHQIITEEEEVCAILQPYNDMLASSTTEVSVRGSKIQVEVDTKYINEGLLPEINNLFTNYVSAFINKKSIRNFKDKNGQLLKYAAATCHYMTCVQQDIYEKVQREAYLKNLDTKSTSSNTTLSNEIRNTIYRDLLGNSYRSFQRILLTIFSNYHYQGHDLTYPCGTFCLAKFNSPLLFKDFTDIHYLWNEYGPILLPSFKKDNLLRSYFYGEIDGFKSLCIKNGKVDYHPRSIVLIKAKQDRACHLSGGGFTNTIQVRKYFGCQKTTPYIIKSEKFPLTSPHTEELKDLHVIKTESDSPARTQAEDSPIDLEQFFDDKNDFAIIHLPTSETDIDFIYLDMMDNILSDNDQAAAKNMLDSLSITYQEILAIETSSAAQQEATPSDIMSATDILASIRENTRKRLLDSITASANPKEDALKKATFERKQAQRKKGKPAPKSKPEKKSSSVKTASPKTNQLMLEETLEELRRQKRLKFNHVTSYMNQIARETGEYSASFQNYLKQNVRVNGSHINGPGGTLVMPHGGSDATVAGVHVAEFIAGLWKTFEDNL